MSKTVFFVIFLKNGDFRWKKIDIAIIVLVKFSS